MKTAAQTRTCKTCGQSLEERRADVRYCSIECRRAAEYEIRRANKRVGELEGIRADIEMVVLSVPIEDQLSDNWGRLPEEQLRAYEDQIAREKQRIRELL